MSTSGLSGEPDHFWGPKPAPYKTNQGFYLDPEPVDLTALRAGVSTVPCHEGTGWQVPKLDDETLKGRVAFVPKHRFVVVFEPQVVGLPCHHGNSVANVIRSSLHDWASLCPPSFQKLERSKVPD